MLSDDEMMKEYSIDEEEIEKEVTEVLGELSEEGLKKVYEDSVRDFEAGTILKGRILEVLPDDAVVDVGYKSEGVIPLKEFEQPEKVKVGDEIEVLLEAVEDDAGLIVISKQKAERIRGWQKVIAEHKEGDVVSGRVMRKIKGGLLVDIGVPVFLPASQVDLRRPGDIAEYVGKEVRCKILKIDQGRRNIVVSRRRLLEEERQRKKEALMAEIEVGEMRKGVVKNILDFGAFVDLGGIDGLLHITDMSWGRISHPSEMLKIDDEIEVKILKVDKERERISLGLKQKTESPWARVEEKYPPGVTVKGEVVNVVNYGGFVKLEDGIEGLVHISEMSWTRRINHPSEVVAIGDMVEVMVLDINKEKEEISLGMKQTEVNPWTLVEEKYPPGTVVKGRVRNFTNYGAFVEIEEGIDGLLHVSDMSWTKKITHPSEVIKKSEKIDVVVLSVDQERKRVALGLKQLQEDPWEKDIPQRFEPGDIMRGRVTKITNFGVFVELEKDLEGLLHISELSEKKVESPEEVVSVGDEVEVKVLRVDPVGRKIGLSLRRVRPEELAALQAEEEEKPTPIENLPDESSEAKEKTDHSRPEEV